VVSTATRRRRPLPRRVYWVRRLLVLAVAFGLVYGIAHLLGSGGDATRPSARPVGAAASSTAPTGGRPLATAPADAPRTAARNRTRAKAKPTPTPLATPSGPCADDDVVVTPSVRGAAYAGRPVTFAMTLTTRVAPACDWDVAAGSLAVRITSGSDRVWSTQDCVAAVPTQSVVVRKDHPVAVTVVWNGQRSDAECTRTTAWAEPGYYHVVAAAFGAEPTDVQFALLTPPRPTITATPTPTKSPTQSPTPSPTATKQPTKPRR
jgi:hypothetical protein